MFRKGTESDEHWLDKSVQVINALLVFVLMRLKGEERSLNTVQEIASNLFMLASAAEELQKIGGIPGRFGSQLMMLIEKRAFERDDSGIEESISLTKEGASVMSSVSKCLSFLDSELVSASLAKSTFEPRDLLKPGMMSIYLQIPPHMLESMKGLLRCWISMLVRMMGSEGDERKGTVLFLLDEASALQNLSALEEALVRGRSAGVRMILAYQSNSQVETAFPGKPSLLYDNATAQIYLGAANSYETAERLSKALGDATWTVTSANESESYSTQSTCEQGSQGNYSYGINHQEIGRPLARPEELMRWSNEDLIVLVRGMPPIWAVRLKYYNDAMFVETSSMPPPWIWLILLILAGLMSAAFVGIK